jgi:hypothetical protein
MLIELPTLRGEGAGFIVCPITSEKSLKPSSLIGCVAINKTTITADLSFRA